MDSKKVLLVCYTFPPMPGVGARRWAKYSKYLIKSNWKVWVVSGTPKIDAYSPWQDDVVGVNHIRLKNKYPQVLNTPPISIWDKLMYRVALLYVKLVTNSNYYDRAFGWKRQFIRTVSHLIEENRIENLIVTGAPFSLLYYGTIIKKKYPKLNYIVDIRDPWTDDNYYGFSSLSKSRKKNEIQRLQSVLRLADFVMVPNFEMKSRYLKYLEPEFANKICVFEHAVDSDLILPRNDSARSLDVIQLVTLGTIYNGLEEVISKLAKVLEQRDNRTQLSFYTSEYKYINIFEKFISNKETISYNPILGQKDVAQLLSVCSAVLFFVPENIKDVLATKYIEVIAARVPIVAVGYYGDVARYLQENRLGIFIETDEIDSRFKNLKNELSELHYNDKFDISNSTFENQIVNLESILK